MTSYRWFRVYYISIIFFILSIPLAYLSNGYCDDWMYIGRTDKDVVYYNESSIRINKRKKYIKVWLKFKRIDKGESLESWERAYSDVLYHFDYNGWKYAITEYVYYNNSNEIIISGKYPINWQNLIPKNVPSDTLNVILHNYDIKR